MSNYVAEAVAAIVQKRRREMGLKQKELATRVGCVPSLVSMIERGERELSFDMLGRVLASLGLRLEFAEADAVSVHIQLHPKAAKALDRLAAAGLYGIGRDGVAQRLIETGLRDLGAGAK